MEGTRTACFIALAVVSSFILCGCSQSYKGRWRLLKDDIGVSAMHIALLPNDRLIVFDRTDNGPSNIKLPEGKCRKAPNDLKVDCTAHSVEFDPVSLVVRPLKVQTDTWCSSGALAAEGVLIQSGGFNVGERAVRYLAPCDGCDWTEDLNGLIQHRWYASSQILPDGRVIVVGGRDEFNYEFVPKSSRSDRKLYDLPFLRDTKDQDIVENNLYPFLHLAPDGNLFIFANDRAILLDYVKNQVVRDYPKIPGGISRNYPSTGSSVLLPLKLVKGQREPLAEILICGGTAPDSFIKSNQGTFLPASNSCGRMVINGHHPIWYMEEMPLNRAMGDMITLPTGDVLIINGAAKGSAGWYVGREPVFHPVLYKPDAPEDRFDVLNPSGIPRMYHSVAHLLSDGRVVVSGSNPNQFYNYMANFPTDLSIEAFYPPYLASVRARPRLVGVDTAGGHLGYNQHFTIRFGLGVKLDRENVYVTMVAPSFTSHSTSMHQRLLVLDADSLGQVPGGRFVIGVFAPATRYLAPPGYYMVFLVHAGVPSKGQWVKIG